MKKYRFWKCIIILLSMLGFSLFLTASFSYAADLDKEEFSEEYKDAYLELLAEDPELAQVFKEEVVQAVKEGEIEFQKEDDKQREQAISKEMEKISTDMKELIERRDDEKGVLPGFDLNKPETQTEALKRLEDERDDLLKAGLSEGDIKTIREAIAKGDKDTAEKVFEKLAPEGFRDEERLGPPPEGFDRRDFEMGKEFVKEHMTERFKEEMGREPTAEEKQMMEKEFADREIMRERHGDFDKDFGFDKEFAKEDMVERFKEEAGREPTEQERQMMEKEFVEHDFERQVFERPEMERAGFERPEMDRAEMERAGFERPEMDRAEFERFEKERPEFERIYNEERQAQFDRIPQEPPQPPEPPSPPPAP